MTEEIEKTKKSMPLKQRILRAIVLTAWTVAGYFVANFLVGLLIVMLFEVHILTASAIDNSAFMASLTAAVFVLTLAIVVGIPSKVRGSRTTKDELGIARPPIWSDLVWAPISFIAYGIIAAVVLQAVTSIFPSFNADEVQQIGFENLTAQYEYILAFITLVVIAPIAEEILFRGYLYGKLRKFVPIIAAVLLSSIVFSLLHLSFDINFEAGTFTVTQWNVALNVLPLAVILALLREKTGSIWAGVLLHAIKNGVAYYFLFVNPSIIDTIVK